MQTVNKIFVNRVLPEHAHAQASLYVRGCIHATMWSTVVVTELVQPAKPKIFIIWPFTEKKNLPIPAQWYHRSFSQVSLLIQQNSNSHNVHYSNPIGLCERTALPCRFNLLCSKKFL